MANLEQLNFFRNALAASVLSQTIQKEASGSDINKIGIAPIVAAPLVTSGLTEKMKAILAADVKPIVNTKFRDAPDISTTKLPCLEEWEDLRPGPNRPCFLLEHLESDEETVRLGREVFGSLRGRVTTKAICNLLTPQLLDPALGKKWEEISDSVLVEVAPQSLMSESVPVTDDLYNSKCAIGYSFLAASYLRLYVKDVNNYTRITAHLISKFPNFYHIPLPFNNFQPPTETLKAIRETFHMNVTLRNTLYNLLYSGESCPVGKDLKTFLYSIHFIYSGIHGFSLFLSVVKTTKVDVDSLLRILYQPIFRFEIKLLANVFKTMYGKVTEECYRFQMWKYGRLFEPGFLNTLQSKHCPDFVATLAYLIKMISKEEEYQSVLNITQIQNMSKEQKEWCQGFATRANVEVLAHMTKAETQNLTRKRKEI